MLVRVHPHAQARMEERGTAREEVLDAVQHGERFPAKFGRTGFRRNFRYQKEWRGKIYAIKQVEVFAVEEGDGWLVITVITRFFDERKEMPTNAVQL